MKRKTMIGSFVLVFAAINFCGCNVLENAVEHAEASMEWTEEHHATTNGESPEERIKDNIEDLIGEIDESDISGQESDDSQQKKNNYEIGDAISFVDENNGEMELTFTDWGTTYDVDGRPVLYVSYNIQNTGDKEIQVSGGMFGVYADNYKVSTSCLVVPDESVMYENLSAGRNMEGKIYADIDPNTASNIEVECGNVAVALKEGIQTDSNQGGQTESKGGNSEGENAADVQSETSISNLVDFYSREIGPKCGMSVWSADENGISFAIGIGSSGALAYVDIRDCVAEWTGENTAVYTEEYGNRLYNLTFTVQEYGFTLSENIPYSEDFSLAGDYIKDSMAEKHCEFVFPEDDIFLIDSSELDGMTAAECKIARNEIYARHGRRFNDEQLQGYFDICSWYNGTVAPEAFSDGVLNEIEKSNLQVISEYESKMGYK